MHAIADQETNSTGQDGEVRYLEGPRLFPEGAIKLLYHPNHQDWITKTFNKQGGGRRGGGFDSFQPRLEHGRWGGGGGGGGALGLEGA